MKKGGGMFVKKKIVVFAVVLAMGCMGALTGSAFAENKGPETMTLDYNGKKKKVENFKHHVHQAKTDCKGCHHKMEAGHDPKACKSCHESGNKVKIKKAYHKTCKDGCHKKHKDKAPTKCKGCHG